MAHKTIALVCDCDDTLAPDTTAQLLNACGKDVEDFYTNHAGKLVNEGYDPSVAYLAKILELLPDLTRQRISEIGAKLKLYPGMPRFFADLENEVKKIYGKEGIHLQEFVITGGIKDLIASSPLATVVDKIWGSNFAYHEDGRIARIKNVVSFTEKTRFLFNIHKGLVDDEYDKQPYAVNMFQKPKDRPVPFKNMIYLGDGPSDIPCMSVVETLSDGLGRTIGVLSEARNRTWELSHGRRASLYVPPDYRKKQNQKWAWVTILNSVLKIAERIQDEIDQEKRIPFPKY